MIFSKATGLREIINIEAEAMAIRKMVVYFHVHNYMGITIEINSLMMVKIINRQWKIPWALVKEIEEIWSKIQAVQGQITHIYREGNAVTYSLANDMVEVQQTKIFTHFVDLPTNIRRYINIDKTQIPNIRIRTHKIKIQ